MKIIDTDFNEVKVFASETLSDKRGDKSLIYSKSIFKDCGIDLDSKELFILIIKKKYNENIKGIWE